MKPARANRLSLQDFQTELARKLAESAQRPMAPGWLGVSWHGVKALLPLTQAGEIFDPVALQRLPHTRPWVLGVASLRGGLTLVLDWVRLLDLPPPAPVHTLDDTVYWVSLNPALGVGAALCCDHLLGLRGAGDFTPDTACEPRLGVRQWLRDAQGQRWAELDAVALVQSPAFMDPRLPDFAVHGPGA